MTIAKLKQKFYDLMVNITVSLFILLAFFMLASMLEQFLQQRLQAERARSSALKYGEQLDHENISLVEIY